MHIYEAMTKARELWGDDAIVKQSICVQNDGRLNIQFEVGNWSQTKRTVYGGGSFEEAFATAGRVTTTKVKIAWIPGIEEYREVFGCDHGLYYCLDPGDGLPTHIQDGDGIEVKEMTEEEAARL